MKGKALMTRDIYLVNDVILNDFGCAKIRTDIDECGQAAGSDTFQPLQRSCRRISNQFHESRVIRMRG